MCLDWYQNIISGLCSWWIHRCFTRIWGQLKFTHGVISGSVMIHCRNFLLEWPQRSWFCFIRDKPAQKYVKIVALLYIIRDTVLAVKYIYSSYNNSWCSQTTTLLLWMYLSRGWLICPWSKQLLSLSARCRLVAYFTSVLWSSAWNLSSCKNALSACVTCHQVVCCMAEGQAIIERE